MCETLVQTEYTDILTIDGSKMEGGGQILRNAIALSALMKKPIRIIKIRGQRDRPGLRPQHLCGIKMIADLCKESKLVGDKEWSETVEFYPYDTQSAEQCCEMTVDTHTAGSTTLLLQSALPLMLYRELSLKFIGGTDALHAPMIDFTKHVFLSNLAKFIDTEDTDIDVKIECKRRGFYPRGGGEVECSSSSRCSKTKSGSQTQLQSIRLIDRGEVEKIECKIFANGLADSVGERIAIGVEKVLRRGVHDGEKLDNVVPVITEREGKGKSKSRRVEVRSGKWQNMDKGKGKGRERGRGRGKGSSVADVILPVVAGLGSRDISLDITFDQGVKSEAFGVGCGVVLYATTTTGCVIGASKLGELGLPAEHVGALAAAELLKAIHSCGVVDEWVQDQIIILMALANGTSQVRCTKPLTLHTTTAIALCEAITDVRRFFPF